MYSGSMSLLGYLGDCGGTCYRTHCYIPVSPSVALCSSGISPNFDLCLPSSYQGNLWLLDNCQEIYGEAPSCESSSSELKTSCTSYDPSNSCVPCSSPTVGKVCSTCASTNVGPSARCSPYNQTKGYVCNCYTHSRCTSKACQTLSNGFKGFRQLNCLSKNFQPLNHCRLGRQGYRSNQNLGFIPSSFSPSCYMTRSCQSQNYSMRNCQYPSYGSMGCQPLSYFSGNFRSLSCIPSTFPPLRYLCSGCRTLNC
ncbi:keratin-associated protein 24-1 [Manis javanica]|uniref:keratin-associated protein 24-1 n=1 Tax=Manis javanica TaxID=9974 RepID=UPI00081308C7|nr:Keratin-associated protein 24-1 [Manis javanica]